MFYNPCIASIVGIFPSSFLLPSAVCLLPCLNQDHQKWPRTTTGNCPLVSTGLSARQFLIGPFQLIKCAALAFPRCGNAHQSLGSAKIYLIGRHILFSPRSLVRQIGRYCMAENVPNTTDNLADNASDNTMCTADNAPDNTVCTADSTAKEVFNLDVFIT